MACFDPCLPEAMKKEDSFWNHAAGPKTVFFWAPVFKWGLVIAGLKDVVTRHASALSIGQTIALFATGVIWSRYSLVIIPKNWGLFSVNLFVAITQMIQLGRAIHYHFYGREAEMMAMNSTMVGFTTIPPDWNSTILSTLSDVTENVI